MVIKEKNASGILNRSKIYDYCVNPYTGCQHRCVYCYAGLFMKRYSGHQEEWGEFVDVKINAVEVIKKQLPKAKKGPVRFSSVCDPYQPIERRYGLTRDLIKEVIANGFPLEILTKSSLVTRDIDILRGRNAIRVGLTIPTDDPTMSRLFEPGASPLEERFEALDKLKRAGIETFVFAGPLLPGDPEKLAELLAGRADSVLIDRMNYVGAVRRFYAEHGLSPFLENRFFDDQARRLAAGLKKRGIGSRIIFSS
jgi:DNA repair photolyase